MNIVLFLNRFDDEKERYIEKTKKKNKKAPTGGLEPPTTRLRAWRSTDWARRAIESFSFHCPFMWYRQFDLELFQVDSKWKQSTSPFIKVPDNTGLTLLWRYKEDSLLKLRQKRIMGKSKIQTDFQEYSWLFRLMYGRWASQVGSAITRTLMLSNFW